MLFLRRRPRVRTHHHRAPDTADRPDAATARRGPAVDRSALCDPGAAADGPARRRRRPTATARSRSTVAGSTGHMGPWSPKTRMWRKSVCLTGRRRVCPCAAAAVWPIFYLYFPTSPPSSVRVENGVPRRPERMYDRFWRISLPTQQGLHSTFFSPYYSSRVSIETSDFNFRLRCNGGKIRHVLISVLVVLRTRKFDIAPLIITVDKSVGYYYKLLNF